MYVGLTPYHARMVANNVDYNWNGRIDNRELDFKNGAKRLVDTDRNGNVSTEELAQSLMRGDIYISNDRKAYPAYYSRPGFGQPGYTNPGYGYGRPGYGGFPPHPRYPGSYAPYPQAPGYPYQNRNISSGENAAISTVVGAGVGAGVGYAVSGPVGVAPGAAIGGIIGLIGSLFD
ncbi:MAG: hypothetical protein IV090_06090 [Candidatus Sericytochromatia bacterium]|jgi:hypothetical protein|nr:hypothetical protein [Candidatus Sericytochromatia bacterium]